MNPTVQAAFDAMLAEIPQPVIPVQSQLGYGRDLSCVTDCTDGFEEVDPDSPRGIAEAITRRFITPRGALGNDDLDYGIDLTGMLHAGLTEKDLRTLQSKLHGEARKDERVDTITIRLTLAASVLSVACRITPRNPLLDPFSMVIQVTSAQVLIELHR